MKNEYQEYFKWSVTRALNPGEDNPQRVTNILQEQAEKFDWEDVNFPTPVNGNDINKFESNNNISVLVFVHKYEYHSLRGIKGV